MSLNLRFRVPEIECGHCAPIIESVLRDNEYGISFQSVQVDPTDKIVTVTVNETTNLPDQASLKQKIRTCLKEQVSFTADFSVGEATTVVKPIEQQRLRQHLIKGVIGVVAGLSMLGLMLSGVMLPAVVTYLLAGFASLLTLYLGKETYIAAFKKLVNAKKLSMDALFAVSTLTALGVSIAALFVPWLHSLFDVALLIFGFRAIGLAIEEKAKRVLTRNLSFRDLVKSPKKIAVNDVIMIKKGELIPVDGVCEQGSAYVIETIYTGNPQRKKINKGYRLVAGTIADDELTMRVTATEADSFLAKADKKIQEARQQKTSLERVADKILQYFVPAVFVFSLVAGVAVGLIWGPALAVQTLVSVLVAACPCALGFVVPLAIRIGMTKAQAEGVTFTDGNQLQTASEIDTIAFDLNGTLTKGSPELVQLKSTSAAVSTDEVLMYLHHLEKKSVHAIGRTIYAYTLDKKVPALSVEPLSGSHAGVRAIINGKCYTVGNESMMRQHRVTAGFVPCKLGEQVIYLAREHELIGYVIVKDGLRDDAKQMIQNLSQAGITEVYICTGADKKTALAYANELGIPPANVYAECVPFSEDNSAVSKLSRIDQLQKRGRKVCMVGDADNDAVAIQKSHLGIAIKSYSEGAITRSNAGAMIEGSSLMPIVAALKVAKQTVSNIKQSLVMSLVYNMSALLVTSGLLIAVGFLLNPAIGVLLMTLQTCLILANAYRFRQMAVAKTAEVASQNTSQVLTRLGNIPSVAPTPALRVMPSATPDRANKEQLIKPEPEVSHSLRLP